MTDCCTYSCTGGKDCPVRATKSNSPKPYDYAKQYSGVIYDPLIGINAEPAESDFAFTCLVHVMLLILGAALGSLATVFLFSLKW